ncbi:hypothetical protein P280DRAFT_387163 [Massarina eburnea CBS 473.64]|uniref:ER transporter 6TM N-terminal domain-containing protein n=1 Tax=Massarina eburnea CBS 473.64 TaxID=1395130 RepID=A0A6A6SG08_9PLEO|nr:hypothetical protein P280DRAFT_387163 [Massarina eburnea CBS 473.64]
MNRSPTSSSATERIEEEEREVVGLEAEKTIEERNHGNADGNADENDDENGKSTDAKPSFLATLWKKIDLDLPTGLMMMKAGLPPTIALAIYQNKAVADHYTTLGYLIAIISILGFCIMPRAKFIQTMTMNILSTCISAAICMLMLWSSVKAREHTTPAGLPPARYRYNSSQSAVLGVWLFSQIWILNTIKARYPQFAFPTIICSIFVNVAGTSGAQFQTVAQVESFTRKLLESFLTGFALAAGVSLFIFPVSCRTVVTKMMTGYVGALRGALKAHKAYFQSLETKDMYRNTTWTPGPGEDKLEKPRMRPEVEAVKSTMGAISQLHGKLHGDLPFAKREMAYGKLSPEDFESISKHLRAIMMPLMGLGSLIDLFERIASLDWDEIDQHTDSTDETRQKMVAEWNGLMSFVHEPFNRILDTMDQGLEHVALRLAFTKPPKTKKGANATDPEAKGETIKPGDKGFTTYMKQQVDEFYKGKQVTLRHWLEGNGIKLPNDFFVHPDGNVKFNEEILYSEQKTNQRQLYIVLYIIFLLHSISRAILAFAEFADEKDQAVMKSKLMTPSQRRFKKWVNSVFSAGNDSVQDDDTTVAGLDRSTTVVYMGEAFNQRKDPEHLPPTNTFEKFGNGIRATSRFLRSPESAFGFRVACATMSIAIIAYLEATQLWFTRQRVVWAMIMVALSMTPTAGQSVFSFILRIVGTAIAMIVAWLIWYIPGTRTPGIIVFLWVFVSLGFYVPLKRADLVVMGLISIVSATMIVGYELQVRKLGEAVATSNGQPYYPITKLGPYRLACVVAGLAVAFFWTFFPFPITEHSALRQRLGGALYLSANFYSIMHETVMARIRGDEGDMTDKESPGRKLEKARNKVFAKQMLTLQGLRTHRTMVDWEFPLGGKFPMQEYDEIIGLVTNIVNYTALLGYASATFTHPSIIGDGVDQSSAQWFQDFRRIVASSKVTSHEITSLLSLLSSSITNGQPLPPYLTAPRSFQLSKRLEALDRDILSIKHVAEPGYAAFAVLQISTRCIGMDVEKLLKAVKKLVGELDFSFHVVSTNSEETLSSKQGKLD